MMDAPLVKVCGLTRRSDAAAAAAAGATYGGVILAAGRSRSVGAAQAAELFAGIELRRTGVFVDAWEDEILESAGAVSLDVVQLHGDEPPRLAESLRGAGLTVWKALRPRSAAELLAGIDRYAGVVDGLLLDGWSARGVGGTGASFDWDDLAPHRDVIPAAVALVVAGGLKPENVARAAALLRPAVVDVSSGVETGPGIKDHRLIRAFVDAAASTAGTE